MPVGVEEVRPTPSIAVVELPGLGPAGIGPVLQTPGADAAEDLVEFRIADEEGVVLRGDGPVGSGEVKADAIGDFYGSEMSEVPGDRQPQHVGKEGGGLVPLAGVHDGVVELDGHGGSSRMQRDDRPNGPVPTLTPAAKNPTSRWPGYHARPWSTRSTAMKPAAWRCELKGCSAASRGRTTPAAVLERVGALQLDTISVLARSHELVCYSRCGPVGRPAVEQACWGPDAAGEARCFEYWAHAACILPVSEWPWFSFRRRQLRRRRRWSLDAPVGVIDEVRRRLTCDGPLERDRSGRRQAEGPVVGLVAGEDRGRAAPRLGEVVCVTRRGWKRVYDLTERALPARLLAFDPDDSACLVHQVERAGACLGVATAAELAEYFRLRGDEVRDGVAGLRPGSG